MNVKKSKLSAAQERYVECIADAEKHHGHEHITLLADKMGVKKPSVVQMVERLTSEGVIERQGREIVLTAAGKKIAGDLDGKHAVLEEFMVRHLGMSGAEANREACQMEHVVSECFLKYLRAYIARCDKGER